MFNFVVSPWRLNFDLLRRYTTKYKTTKWSSNIYFVIKHKFFRINICLQTLKKSAHFQEKNLRSWNNLALSILLLLFKILFWINCAHFQAEKKNNVFESVARN